MVVKKQFTATNKDTGTEFTIKPGTVIHWNAESTDDPAIFGLGYSSFTSSRALLVEALTDDDGVA